MIRVLAIALLFAATAVAVPTRATAQEQRLPNLVTHEGLANVGRALEGVVVPLRSRTDLGPGYRPRLVEGDGAATFVRFPDDTTGWITSFSHCAQAQTIELLIDGAWHAATPAHGTVVYDLVRLTLDDLGAQPADERALPIAATWPADGNVYSVEGVDQDDTTPVQPIVFGLGPRPRGDFEYYVRSLAILRNGYPIVSLDGELLAVTSMAAADRAGGVFAIPLEMIRSWVVEWPQLRGNSGWEPRIIEERVEINTGQDAFAP